MANRTIDTGIIKRGKTYQFTVSMGMDSNNKQIRKTTTFKPPLGISEKKADKLAKEEYIRFKEKCLCLGSYNGNMRFRELVDVYFNVYAKNRLKPATAYNYKKMIDYRFMDYFGNKKLKDITTGMLTDFFNKQTIKSESNPKPLKPITVKRIFNIMQSIFSFAILQHYVIQNPCIGVILPQRDVTEDDKRKSLSEDEMLRFLPLFSEYSILNTIVKLLLYTGMRSGECLALRWEDIDFENKVISIKHTLTDVGGKHFLTTPKTKTSKRYISMGDTVYSLLQEHKIHQQELITALGNECLHPEMVFTSNKGNYKDRSCLNTSFKKYLENTEFNHITLHCLRHCNATLLINSGVDLKIVSEHLGHSDVSTTANIYTDVLESTKIRTAEILENRIIYH